MRQSAYKERYISASNTNHACWAAANAAGLSYVLVEHYAEPPVAYMTDERVVLWAMMTLILMVPFFTAFKISGLFFQNSIVRFVADAALALVLVVFTLAMMVVLL